MKFLSYFIHVVFSIIVFFYSKVKVKPIIVFESVPDYSDNSLAVFNEMIKRGLNDKYTLVWMCKSKWQRMNYKNVHFVISKFWKHIYLSSARCLISSNVFLVSNNKRQKSIYLTHGEALKKLNNYHAPQNIDYVIGLSIPLNEVMAKELHLPDEKFNVTGFPRNDDLLNANNRRKVRNLFGEDYNHIIIWFPTFRQHKSESVHSYKASSLPIIHDKEAAININEYAHSFNILIVIKPHFAQDLSYIKDNHLSNILFIDDSLFKKNNINTYELVGGCDGLITDYSSIYFDYLLTNKPVAAIWEDIDEYRKKKGFALDIDYYMKGAVKIYDEDDFINFITSIFNGEDNLKNEREEIKNEVHEYQDANSSKRVVDFIETNILNR